MRLPEKDENLIGKVCVCSVGRPAIVTGKQFFNYRKCWVGLGLDGKGTWLSSSPAVLAESGQDFYTTLSERFNGKMSFNG
jgi:hypothetical protein